MMNTFLRIFQKRAIPTSPALAIYPPPQAYSQGMKSYDALAKEGYHKCVVAYQCINLVANCVADIPFCLYSGRGNRRKEIEDHPILDLLRKPNPMQSGKKFQRNVISYFLLSGNSFVQAIGPSENEAPAELWPKRPDMMKVVPGAGGIPAEYIYKVNQKEYRFPVTITGDSAILHMKTFNPCDEWYGMSPLSAAAFSVDTLNSQARWNFSLLENGARPGFAIVMKTGDGMDGIMPPDVKAQLRKDLENNIQGSRNAGRPLILEGGLDIKPLGFSPAEMDYLNSKKVSEKDVALAFGVPGQMVGVESSQTFANWEQARLALYEDTILPLKKLLCDDLNSWLVPTFGEDLELGVDEDEVSALEPRRWMKWDKAKEATWLTPNEQRAMAGYDQYVDDSVEPADKLYVPLNVQPIEIAGAAIPPDEPETDIGDLEKPPADEEDGDTEGEAGLFDIGEEKSFNLRTDAQKRRYLAQDIQAKKRFEAKFQAQLRRYFRTQRDTMSARLKSAHTKTAALHIVHEVLDADKAALVAIERGILRPVMDKFGQRILSIAKSSYANPEVKDTSSRFEFSVNQFIRKHAEEMASQVNGTTYRRLQKVIDEAYKDQALEEDASVTLNIPKAAEDAFDRWSEARSLTISRTEIHQAATEASQIAAKSLGIPSLRKEWVAAEDARTRPGHAEVNGDTRDLEDKFTVPYGEGKHSGMDLMDGPGDKSADPSNLVNCRCALTYSTNGTEGDEE